MRKRRPSKSLVEAEAEIRDLGLPLPDKPMISNERQDNGEIEITWPADIGLLSPQELGEHLTWWSGWASYARYYLARAEVNVETSKEAYDLERSIRIFKSSGDYEKVTEVKAAIAQMPDMVNMKGRLLEAKAQQKLLRSLVEGYDAKYATISRELSRRGLDFEQSRYEQRGSSRQSFSRSNVR
jgi:hypothetical protein